MEQAIDFDELEAALRRCGSTWEVAQAHGLLCSRLATEGAPAGQAWLEQVLEGVDAGNAAARGMRSDVDCCARFELPAAL